MNIKIYELIEGAQQARGLTVIIDVFRAFSLECYLFHAGAKEIYAVGKEETARIMKMHHDEYVLVGELGLLRKDPLVDKFFDPKMQEIFPEEDYWLCTMYDRFDKVLKVEQVEKDVFHVTEA